MVHIAKKIYLHYIFILVFSVFLFVGGPDYYSSRSMRALWNLGHIVLFFLAVYVLLKKSSRLRGLTFWAQIFWVLLFTTIVGLGIEFLQGGINRTPEMNDLLRDLLGSLSAVVVYSINKKYVSRRILNLIYVVIVFLIICNLLPLTKAVIDELLAKDQFPVLSDFETILENQRWETTEFSERSSEIAYHGNYSLKCIITPEKYSGAYLKYFPSDWNSHNFLYFHIYSTAEFNFDLHCRIHDNQHIYNNQPYPDRYNTILNIKPGWNNFRLNLDEVKNAPQMRQMNLDQIRSLAFFGLNLPRSVNIFIDYVYLN